MKWIALLVVLAGCPGIPHPLERPRVDVHSVAVQDVSLTSGVTLVAHLEVTNPNSVGLPLRAIDWQVSLDQKPIARGRVDLPATIPAKNSAPVDTTFTIGPGQAMNLVSALGAGPATIEVDGTMHFSTALGDLAAEFQSEQQVSR
jgi:LEA14-like dessication related protein